MFGVVVLLLLISGKTFEYMILGNAVVVRTYGSLSRQLTRAGGRSVGRWTSMFHLYAILGSRLGGVVVEVVIS